MTTTTQDLATPDAHLGTDHPHPGPVPYPAPSSSRRPALPAPALAAALRAAATGPELVAALDAAVHDSDLATASAEELAGLWVAAVRTTLWSDHLQRAVRAEVDARLRRHGPDPRGGHPDATGSPDDALDETLDDAVGLEDAYPWEDDLDDEPPAEPCDCCR